MAARNFQPDGGALPLVAIQQGQEASRKSGSQEAKRSYEVSRGW